MTRADLVDLLARMRDRLAELDARLEDAAALGNDSDETADLGFLRAAIVARIAVVEDLLRPWLWDEDDDE
jgi:hypothetical protein